MTTRYKTRGFIFKKADRDEADRSFSIFTEDFGRLEIFAKAIRKINSKLRAGIDVFYFSDVEFICGKNKKTLTDAAAISNVGNIINDSKKIEVAKKISVAIDDFVRGQEKDELIFNLLNEVFLKINSQEFKIKNYELAYFYFFWNFLSVLGYHPEILKCAVCREKLNPYNIYFSNKHGGIICKKCVSFDKDALKINSDVVKILRLILKKDWQTLSKLKIELSSQNLLIKISDNYYKYVLPVSLSGSNKI